MAINHQPQLISSYAFNSYLSGIIAQIRRKDLPFFNYSREKVTSCRRNIKKALKDDRICFVYPPKASQTESFTTDRTKLLETHCMGRREAERILRFIG